MKSILFHDNNVGGEEKAVPIETLVTGFLASPHADPMYGPFRRRFLFYLHRRVDNKRCVYFGVLSFEQWSALEAEYKKQRAKK